MKIKRYLARDMQEAYLAIRRDLGPEAVIVTSRQVRQPGLMGFFLPPRLEVTAALEDVASAPGLSWPAASGRPAVLPPREERLPAGGAGGNGAAAAAVLRGTAAAAAAAGSASPGDTGVTAPRQLVLPAAGGPGYPGAAAAPGKGNVPAPRPAVLAAAGGRSHPEAAPPGAGGPPGLEGLQRQLAEIKAALGRLAPAAAPVPEHLALWRQRLLAQELEEELVTSLLDAVEEGVTEDILSDILRTRLADHLRQRVAGRSRQRVQAFIGPTGVGKTTTLAKIAAHYSLYEGQKVGLITLDTYRIGAVDQLKTYAEIMGLPLEVAMTPRDLREATGRLESCDVILVDTAGRAPENKAMLAETRGFLEVIPEREVYLVLSCTTRRQDLLLAAEHFRSLQYNRLIFTKMDETGSPGVIVTVAAAAGVPLAYITTGQDVPDDLEAADPHLLARRIWEAVAADGPGGQAA